MKRIAIVFLAFIGVGLLLVALDPQRAKRAVFMATMFQGVDMTDEFSDMQSLFPSHPVRTSNPTPLATATTEFALPLTYEYQGETRNLRDFLQETDTSGLIVLRDGQVIHEEYALGSSPPGTFNHYNSTDAHVLGMLLVRATGPAVGVSG
jgi:hypothetical protein